MAEILDLKYAFDISSDAAFDWLSRSFAHALHAVAPLGSIGFYDEKRKKTLYHPFRVGVIGRPASGKSIFLSRAAKTFMESEGIEQERSYTVPSHDQKRSVLVWSQWIRERKNPFRISIEDQQAQYALLHNSRSSPPEAELPAINMYEHPDRSILGVCGMILRIQYSEEGKRHLTLETNDRVARRDPFQKSFLSEVQDLRVDMN